MSYAGIPDIEYMTTQILNRYQSASDEAKQHANWYQALRKVCRDLGDQYGVDWVSVAGALAWLSPQVSIEQAIKSTTSVLDAYVNDNAPPSVHYQQNVGYALECLDGNYTSLSFFKRPGVHKRARKVRSFWRNILGSKRHVTVDRWVVRQVGADLDKQPRGGAYIAIQEAFQNAAKRLNIDPPALQAVLWVDSRGSAW